MRFVVAEPPCWLKCFNYTKVHSIFTYRHYCVILFSHSAPPPKKLFLPQLPNKILSDVLKLDQIWRFQLKNCKYTPKMFLVPPLPPPPWRSHWGVRGLSAPLDSKKITINWEKEGENQKKSGKRGKVLSLCPSWQIGLATLLRSPPHFEVNGTTDFM